MLDLAFSFFFYLWVAVWEKFDFGICIKPYPNALLPLLLTRFIVPSVRIGTDIDDMDHGYRTGFLPAVLRALQKPLPRLCDIVTCHNDALERWIPSEYGVAKERIFRLDQGVDFKIFHPATPSEREQDRTGCRDRYGLPEGKILVYTAHLNIASDLDDILEAFKIAYGQRKDVSLLVAGGGPMLSHYRSLARGLGIDGRVFFTGSLPPEKIRACANAADFCLVYYKDKPVNHFRTSMKIRECLAMARPVIANDTGDLKEFQRFVYPAGTGAAGFAEGLISALRLAGPDGRESKAAEYIRERYDWDRIAEVFSTRLSALK
jgi:glycosyltransferase involved in cell wall biosynthesis